MYSAWTDVVTAALNEVRYGVVLLDRTLNALFINRAFHEMWALPLPRPGTTYTFRDLMEHGQQTAAYQVSPEEMRRYVDKRIVLVEAGTQPPMQLPLSDGRTLSFECIALPDGGRMLTYTDVTEHVHAIEQLRELATVDDLTKLLNRRQFLASLEAEYRRSVLSNANLSVLMIDADNFKQINDRHGTPRAIPYCVPWPSVVAVCSGSRMWSAAWAVRSSLRRLPRRIYRQGLKPQSA